MDSTLSDESIRRLWVIDINKDKQGISTPSSVQKWSGNFLLLNAVILRWWSHLERNKIYLKVRKQSLKKKVFSLARVPPGNVEGERFMTLSQPSGASLFGTSRVIYLYLHSMLTTLGISVLGFSGRRLQASGWCARWLIILYNGWDGFLPSWIAVALSDKLPFRHSIS